MIQISEGSSITINGHTYTDNSFNWKTDAVKTDWIKLIETITKNVKSFIEADDKGDFAAHSMDVILPSLRLIGTDISVELAAYCAKTLYDKLSAAIQKFERQSDLYMFPYRNLNGELNHEILKLNTRKIPHEKTEMDERYNNEHYKLPVGLRDELKVCKVMTAWMVPTSKHEYYSEELKRMFLKKCEIYIVLFIVLQEHIHKYWAEC
jgi:hypothetical protein